MEKINEEPKNSNYDSGKIIFIESKVNKLKAIFGKLLKALKCTISSGFINNSSKGTMSSKCNKYGY